MQKKPDKQSKQQENDQGDQYAGQVIHRTCKEIRNPSGTDDIQIQLRIPDAIGVLVLKQMELITGFRKVLSGWRGFIRYKGVGESLSRKFYNVRPGKISAPSRGVSQKTVYDCRLRSTGLSL